MSIKEDVIIQGLIDQLEDLRKDIDMNYRRMHYDNPLVPRMMKLLVSQLDTWTDALKMPIVQDAISSSGISREPDTLFSTSMDKGE